MLRALQGIVTTFGCACLLAAAQPVAADGPRKLLATKVQWSDATGAGGSMLFQGTIDSLGNLEGRVYPGNGMELLVAGTVGEGGSVSGSLDTIEHEHLGTFQGQLNAQQELEGALEVSGQLDSEWYAPADELPTE